MNGPINNFACDLIVHKFCFGKMFFFCCRHFLWISFFSGFPQKEERLRGGSLKGPFPGPVACRPHGWKGTCLLMHLIIYNFVDFLKRVHVLIA